MTSSARLTGPAARLVLWLTLVQLHRHGTHPVGIDWLWEYQKDLPPSAELLAAKIRLLTEVSGPTNAFFDRERADFFRHQADQLCQSLLGGRLYEESLDCNLAASLQGVTTGNLQRAKLFLLRQQNVLKPSTEKTAPNIPDSAYAVCMCWAELLRAAGRIAQPGFGYVAEKGMLPESALECALYARNFGGEEPDWDRRMQALMEGLPCHTNIALGLSARISLSDQSNWRKQLKYGLHMLENMLVDGGMAEIASALRMAESRDQRDAFTRMLAAEPSSSYILSALQL